VNNVVKYPCNTRWENKIASIKVVRFELPRILCALTEVGEECMHSKSAAEVSGINRSIFSFEFILITIIWFEVLSRANPVSKVLQSTDMIIDIAVAQLDSLVSFMKDFRNTGFTKCLDSGSNALFDKWQIDCRRLTRRPRFCEEDPVKSTTDTFSPKKRLKLKCLIT